MREYSRPYLESNETIAFLIEWGGLALFLALALAPFFVLLLKRFRPTKYKHIIWAYAGSFGMFFLIEITSNYVHSWMINSFVNYGWIVQAWGDASLRELLWLLLIWPSAIFYSTKLLYKKFNKKRFFVSLGLSILLFAILVTILFNYMVWSLFQAGIKYF